VEISALTGLERAEPSLEVMLRAKWTRHRCQAAPGRIALTAERMPSLHPSFPQVADMLTEAEADLTAFAAFPREHWPKIWSNNPIERLNREIKRRADVVQVFPDRNCVRFGLGEHVSDLRERGVQGVDDVLVLGGDGLPAGPDRVCSLPQGALAQDLVQQPHRASQP
jgi:transposase-like protein